MLGISNLVFLYRIRLRRRWVQEVLAAAGIATGVALVFAAAIANTSLVASVQTLTRGLAGDSQFQITGRAPEGIPMSRVNGVSELPGVARTAPVLEARAIVRGSRGSKSVTLLSSDTRLARLGGQLVRHLTSEQLARQAVVGLPAAIAREIGATFGGTVDVQTRSGTTRAALGAELHESDIGSLVNSPVLIVPLKFAQQMTGLPGQVSRVFVEPKPGETSLVEQGLRRYAGDRLDIHSALFDVDVFRQAAGPTSQSTALFSAFAAMVGFLFAVSAVVLTVPQRRRFIIDLRMAGHGPAAVAQIMLFDALVLGLVGSAIGLVLGDLLSRNLFSTVPGYLSFAFPLGAQRVVTWSSVGLALFAGVVASCLAVMVPLRDIVTLRPDGRRATMGRDRAPALAWASVVLAVVAAAVALLFPSWSFIGIVALTASLLLALPALLRGTVNLLNRAGHRVRSAVPALALMELRSRRSGARTFALAATGAIAVFASVAIEGAHHDLLRGLDASARQIDGNGDVWATFPGDANAFATVPFKPDAGAAARVKAVPGVLAVRTYRGGFLDVGSRRVWVLAPPNDAAMPIPDRQLVRGDFDRASARVRRGGWVVLSAALARGMDVSVGDQVVVPSPVPTRMRVAALSTNLGWPPGAMVMNATDYARAWGNPAPSAWLVDVSPGASADRVAAGVRSAIGNRMPVTVETSAQRQGRHYAAARAGLSRLTQISSLVLGSAILAMAIAMGATLWQRRDVIARLKVDGFTELELWLSLLIESAILLGTGCVAGAVVGLAGQAILSNGLVAITGFPVFYGLGWSTALTNTAIVVAVALLMLMLPGWAAVRVRPSPDAPT